MKDSYLALAHGIRGMRYRRTDYKDNTIIINIEFKKRKKICPHCGKCHLVLNGYRMRLVRTLPCGWHQTWLNIKLRRYRCKDCGHDFYERPSFVRGNRSYTYRFEKYIVKMLRYCTIKHASLLTGVGWDTIKEIHSEWLAKHYSPPSLKGVKNIGIDEFSTRRGRQFMTIVIDLDTKRIIYARRGRNKEALQPFWNRVRRQGVKIEHITTDMSHAYISSIMENAPEAIHIFDHFHIVKLMNDALNEIRQQQYHMERCVNRRNVLKGTMYLLLRNGEDVMDKRHKNRLENALAMNEPLSKAYYLKEALREIWNQTDKETAEKTLCDWCEQAEQSKIRQLIKMANTIRQWRKGILAWYNYRISNAIVEGTNNKIKVLKRSAYGFRDEKYFKLRLYALHE